MKAKCPYCKNGCDKCVNGFLEVALRQGEVYTRVCLDFLRCGFINGGYIPEDPSTLELEDSGRCVNCDGRTQWMLASEAPDSEAWKTIENQLHWHILRSERTINKLRDYIEKIRELAIAVANPEAVFTVEECKLLFVCRICKKKADGPLTMNYGKEFAHTKCLEKENSLRCETVR